MNWKSKIWVTVFRKNLGFCSHHKKFSDKYWKNERKLFFKWMKLVFNLIIQDVYDLPYNSKLKFMSYFLLVLFNSKIWYFLKIFCGNPGYRDAAFKNFNKMKTISPFSAKSIVNLLETMFINLLWMKSII